MFQSRWSRWESIWSKGFVKDTRLKNISRESHFSDHQCRLIRSIVPYHFEFIKKETVKRNQFREKKWHRKKHETLSDTFTLIEECEKSLTKVSRNFLRYSLTTCHLLHHSTMKNLYNVFVKAERKVFSKQKRWVGWHMNSFSLKWCGSQHQRWKKDG